MGAALNMSTSISRERISDEGRRAASHFAASQLTTALQSQNVFKAWEIQAIVEAFTEVLKRDGKLSEEALASALHSHCLPKDLADPLAKVLSRDR